MGGVNNWPVPTAASDYFRQSDKRTLRNERRPQIKHASDLLGPGIAPRAIQIRDWNSEETRFNGFFYSAPGSLNTPDGNQWWIGQSTAHDGDYGVQVVRNYRAATVQTFSRTFAPSGTATPFYSPWTEVVGGGGGGTGEHSHDTGDITDLASVLAAKADEAITLTAGEGLNGGGNLSANRTFTVDFADEGLGNSTQAVRASDPRLSNARTPTAHVHTIAEVTGLQTALDGKASANHAHSVGQVTGLQAALDAKVDETVTVTAGTGMTGGGDLSTSRTLAVDFAASGTSSATKAVRADDSRLSNARTPTAHTHTIADLPVAASGTSSATQVVRADDSRLSNARTPTAHTHSLSELTAGVLSVPLVMTEQAAPATPANGQGTLYVGTDGAPYFKNDTGGEYRLIPLSDSRHANADFDDWTTDDGRDTGVTDDIPTDWTAFWAASTVGFYEDNTDKVSGTASLRIVRPAGANARIQSSGTGGTFDVQPGDIVTVAVSAKASTTGVSLGVDLLTRNGATPEYFDASTTTLTRTVSLSTTWKRYEVSFTVPSDHNRARISFAHTHASATTTAWLDNSNSAVRTPSEAPVIPGTIIMWGLSGAVPGGYLLMDGTTYNVADYPALGTLYTTNGTTFTLPDMRRRFPVGAGSGLSVGANDGHTTVTDRSPLHTHSASGLSTSTFTHNRGVVTNSGGADRMIGPADHSHNVTGSTGSAGGFGAGQFPYWTLNFLIKT